ncbi:MAG: hypothetical protein WCK65_12710, partial [Rhodospirillaceae bacterium]
QFQQLHWKTLYLVGVCVNQIGMHFSFKYPSERERQSLLQARQRLIRAGHLASNFPRATDMVGPTLTEL